MSEEEKQAIEYIRNCLDDEYDFKNATRQKDKEVYKIILELIKKQQKEIERIEKKLKRYQKYLRDSEKKCDKLLEFEYTERERFYICKDKIIEKIKKLETSDILADYIGIQYLKELLGE